MFNFLLPLLLLVTTYLTPLQTREVIIRNAVYTRVDLPPGHPFEGKACNTPDGFVNCTNGSFVDLDISPSPTQFRGDFSTYHDTVLEDGFKVRYIQCDSKELAIFSVSDLPNGKVRVKVYINGDVDPEITGNGAGGCPGPQAIAGQMHTLEIIGGNGSPFTSVPFNAPIKLAHSVPAEYMSNQSLSGGFSNLPVSGGQHYNVVTGAYTPLTTCDVNPNACPKSTSGQFNYLILYVSGMENSLCAGNCGTSIPWRVDAVLFGQLTPELPLAIEGIYSGGYSYEQVNINLGHPNIVPQSVYRLDWKGNSPFSSQLSTITINSYFKVGNPN